MNRRLQKSGTNRILFGVAGGIAEYARADPVIIRVLFILLAFAGGFGVLLYAILALIMPRADAPTSEPLAVLRDNLQTAPGEAARAGRRIVEVLRGSGEEGRSG